MKQVVLFVDDEPHITESLKRALRKEPYEILTARSPLEAFKILEKQPVDIVVSDENMPEMKGSNFISQLRKKYPDTIRMILTGQPNLEAIIQSINQGEVYRFFTKPIHEVDLAITIRQALRHKELIVEIRRLLKTARNQLAALEELEKNQPGSTRVKVDPKGSILIEDTSMDLEALIQQIRTEVSRLEKFNPKTRS